MKYLFLTATLCFSSVVLAEKNIEVLPDSISENPSVNYSDQNQGNKAIKDVTDSVSSKVNDTLKTKSQTDMINKRLSALKNKISSHQHQLKLKTKALKVAHDSSESKIKSKSKASRAKLKRIIGATTTTN